MTKQQRQLAGTPTADLALDMKALQETLAQMASNGYADTHRAVADMRKSLSLLTAEMARREDGGKILTDICKPYMTDGEYLAACLEPPSDNA